MTNDVFAMLEAISQAVRDDDVDLTSWEAEFIESIRANLEAGIYLTEKQDSVLVRIWKKCTQ